MAPIRFTPGQREELLQLGYPLPVIELLETDGMPTGKLHLAPLPAVNDVRDELLALQSSLEASRAAIARINGAPEALPHLREAKSKLKLFGQSPERRQMDELALALSQAGELVSAALGRLPKEQTRSRSATPSVVNALGKAMQLGMLLAGIEVMPRRLRPSSSPTSAFRKMVGLCYEAMGSKVTDPERAIRAYMRKWRALEEHTRRIGLESGTEGPRTR